MAIKEKVILHATYSPGGSLPVLTAGISSKMCYLLSKEQLAKILLLPGN